MARCGALLAAAGYRLRTSTVTDSFTGTNGSAWAAPWVRTLSGGTIDIQSNAGRILTAAATYTSSYASRPGVVNGEVLFDVTFPNVAAEQYFYAHVRSDSGTTMSNSYALVLMPSFGQTAFVETVGGDDSVYPKLATGNFTYTAATPYRVRLRWEGASLKARVWLASGSEPTAWTIAAADVGLSAAGSFMFQMVSGAAATARSVTIDNWSLTDLGGTAGAITGSATAADALGWGSPVASEEFASLAGAIANGWSVFDAVSNQWGTKEDTQVTASSSILRIDGTGTGLGGGLAWFDDNAVRTTGRWEVRMRVPSGDENWKPVLLLWPLAEDWPAGGEVDFAESGAGNAAGTSGVLDVGFNLHYSTDGTTDMQVSSHATIDIRQWHHYAVELTSTGLRGYIDGCLWFESATGFTLPPRDMWLGIQTDWLLTGSGQTSLPVVMEVDWVRVYA